MALKCNKQKTKQKNFPFNVCNKAHISRVPMFYIYLSLYFIIRFDLETLCKYNIVAFENKNF